MAPVEPLPSARSSLGRNIGADLPPRLGAVGAAEPGMVVAVHLAVSWRLEFRAKPGESSMKAIETLILEHQSIGRLVDALDAYSRGLEQLAGADASHLAEFAALFTEFAECLHHEKEESILLPALSRSGVRWDVGPLPAVRRDHRQEAYLIDVLRQAGERAGLWNAEERRRVAAAAQALVAFQRAHHTLESTELFPLVESQLSEQQREELGAALQLFDQRHEMRRSAALSRMDALVARYAPVRHSGVQSLLSGGPALAAPDRAVGDLTEPIESRLDVDL